MSSFTYRPPSFLNMRDEDIKAELDKAISQIYSAHATLARQTIQSPTSGGGFNVMSGTATVTGSKLNIPTGLTTVTQVVVSIDAGANASNQWATGTVTPTNRSTINIYVWAPTSSSDNTPIASTTSTVVNWWATGTI